MVVHIFEDFEPPSKKFLTMHLADVLSNKKLKSTVTKLFIRGRNLNICLVFITQSYFAVPKRLDLTLHTILKIKIPSKQQLQPTAFNHSSDIDFKSFMNLYKKCTENHILFYVLMLLLHQKVLHNSERIF